MPFALVVNAVGELAGGAAEDGVFAGTAGVDLARGAVGSATPAEVGEGGKDSAGGERVESGKHVRRCKRLHVLII